MRRLRAILMLAAVLLPARGWAQEDTPGRVEQLIYSILSYNGRDYSPTFCRADEGTICVIADADSFVSVRTSLVYYWPISGDWHTDSKTLNVMYDGVVEILDRAGQWTVVHPVRYTSFNRQGRYNQNWEIATGDEADEEWARYEEMVSRYHRDMEEHARRKVAWEEEYAALAHRIASLREAGEPYRDDLVRLEQMVSPPDPMPPDYYLVPPAQVRTGYVLHLPPGTYTMRFRDTEGLVLEGSEKTLIAFPRRRTDQIGYDIIPADKWTRVGESSTPSSVLYVNGTADLYLRPFYQDEYNDLFYRKAMKNDATGNPNITTWAKIQQVESAVIEVDGGSGESLAVAEQAYFVEQSPGTAMGYTIVPFDPEGAHSGGQPTLRGFRIPMDPTIEVTHIRVKTDAGKYLEGSERQIRTVAAPHHPFIALPLAFIPLPAYVVVHLTRRRRLRRFDEHHIDGRK